QVPNIIGYTLTGWFTSSACTGTATTSFLNLSTTDGAVVQRYAKQEVKPITVTYLANGQTVSTKTYTYGDAYGTLPTIESSILSGYTFGGWFNDEKYSEQITATTKVQNENNHNIYAKLTAKTVKIAFSFGTGTANNNSSTAGDTLYKIGDVINLRATVSTGYSFNTWTGTNINGTIASSGMAGTTYTITGADTDAGNVLTFTATATINTYTVKFWIVNVTDNTTTLSDTKAFTYGTSQTVAVPTVTGYTTTGWFTNADFTGTSTTTLNNLTTINGATVNVYAKREVITYVITYVINGETYKTENVTYGTKKSLLNKSDICTDKNLNEANYTFFGWFSENPSGKGDLKNLATTISVGSTQTSNLTFYGRLFKTRACGEEGYSDAKIEINVNFDSGLKSGEGYGIVLVEYFDSELGYVRNYSFVLTNGKITIDGLKYADVKITVKTNIKASADKQTILISTSSKSSDSVTINVSKVSQGGYTDVGTI
ncbi:MAG: InlB B-repeat-containing protein, partial [Christensenellales bacterium]